MTRAGLCFLAAVLISAGAFAAEAERAKPETQVDRLRSFLPATGDLDKLEVRKTEPCDWTVGWDAPVPGLAQEVTYLGARFDLRVALCAEATEASKAAEFEAALGKDGLEEREWIGDALGDARWRLRGPNALCVIVRAGMLALSVRCDGGDYLTRHAGTRDLASLILRKQAERLRVDELDRVRRVVYRDAPLRAHDLPGLVERGCMKDNAWLTWWHAYPVKADEPPILSQTLTLGDARLTVRYVLFLDEASAEAGPRFFREKAGGTWRRDPVKAGPGDETWGLSAETDSAAIIVRTGALCVWVSARGRDAEERHAAALAVAEKIVEKWKRKTAAKEN